MDHHSIAYIDAHMGCTGGVVGSLEKDQVARSGIGAGNRCANIKQPLCAEPAYIPAAVIDDPADESGAVKRGGRTGAAPDIRVAQVLFRFRDHGGKHLILQGLRRDVVISIRASLGYTGIFALWKQVQPIPVGGDVSCIHFQLFLAQHIYREVRKVKVFQLHIADVIVIGNIHNGHFSCVRVNGGFGPVTDFHFHRLGQGVLTVKKHGKRALHLRKRPFSLVVGGQKGDQDIGIVGDFIQVKMVFIVSRMQSLIVIQLVLQICLHLCIGRFRTQHICVLTGICCGCQGGNRPLEQYGTRGQAAQKHGENQEKGNGNAKALPVTPDKFPSLFDFLSGLFCSRSGVFRRFCRSSSSLPGMFGSGILLFNSLLLLPAGNRIAGKLGIFLQGLLIQSVDICFFQPLLRLCCFTVRLELMRVVALPDQPPGTFRSFFDFVGAFHAHIVIF